MKCTVISTSWKQIASLVVEPWMGKEEQRRSSRKEGEMNSKSHGAEPLYIYPREPRNKPQMPQLYGNFEFIPTHAAACNQ